MTDGDLSTLGPLEDNIDLNNLVYKDKPSIEHLYWGKHDTLDVIQSKYQPFDIVIGSDLVYFDSSIEPLFYTVDQLLSKTQGSTFYLSFLDRKNHLPTVERISDLYGFELINISISSFVNDISTVSSMAKMFVFKRKTSK